MVMFNPGEKERYDKSLARKILKKIKKKLCDNCKEKIDQLVLFEVR